MYVLSGESKVTIGSETNLVTAGQCVFYGPDVVTEVISVEHNPVTYYSVHFDWHADSPEPMSMHKLLSGVRKYPRSALVGSAAQYSISVGEAENVVVPAFFPFPGAEPILRQMYLEFEERKPGFEFVLRGLLGRLLTAVLRLQLDCTSQDESHKKIAPAIRAIDQQPEAEWSIAALAELCGYNSNYFCDIFKAATGQTPKSYLMSLRIKRAKRLLLEEDTIEKAALKSGYSSLHYFCRHFKAETGQTPSQYKRQLLDL
jgi:AraC-like DNA-binding protein